MSYIIVTGNPKDGFVYIGPFDSHEDAVQHAEWKANLEADWWVIELLEPES